VFSLAVSIAKVLAASSLLGPTDHSRFQVVAMSFVGMMIFLGSINYFEWKRMANYLEENHSVQTPFSNIGLPNFLKSKENYGDPFVDELKSNYGLVYAFTLIAFLTGSLCVFS
jgi:hypothetical protein